MRHLILSLTSVGALLLTSSIVEARMLVAASDWSSSKVESATPYCTMARQYEANIVLTFARNAKGEGTIAFDFQRNAFDLTRPYPITLKAGNVLRQYVVKPANNTTIIMRTSTDTSLFSAMSNVSSLNIKIDSEKFDIDLSGYKQAFENLMECSSRGMSVEVANKVTSQEPVYVERKIPRPPVLQEATNSRNVEIQDLLDENRRLTKKLTDQDKVVDNRVVAIPVSQSSNNLKLLTKLADAEKRNLLLLKRVSGLEKQIQNNQISVNPDLSEALKEKDIQILSLKRQNQDLKNAVEQARLVEPEVIIKEVIREVPVNVNPSNDSGDNFEMAMKLSEVETQALSFKAERDEYRRLLQNERKRLKNMGNLTQQASGYEVKSNNIIEDMRKLEAEKIDLIRQLEFAKVSVDPVKFDTDHSIKAIDDLSSQLDFMRDELKKIAAEKTNLEIKLAMAEVESSTAQQQLASLKNTFLKTENNSKNDIEMQSMRVDLIELEAENIVLRGNLAEIKLVPKTVINNTVVDPKLEKRLMAMEAENVRLIKEMSAMQSSQDKKSTQIVWNEISTPELNIKIEAKPVIQQKPIDNINKITGKPVNAKTTEVASSSAIVTPNAARTALRQKISSSATVRQAVPQIKTKIAPTISVPKSVVEMVALSGDDIRQLIASSRIPLKSQISRVDRVSGPDFAAFSWDTGVVYGSGEQSRLSNVSAFDKSVSKYIQKTKQRCEGSFDQTLQIVPYNDGLVVKSADIACVSNSGGNAASILFFAHNGMFYALAHEADMKSFETAMDMRDKLSASLSKVF